LKGHAAQDFRKNLKLKQGDIKTRVRGNLTTMIWKDKSDVNMLTNMHHPPAEGNFYDKHGSALKPVIIQESNRLTWKWTKNCSFAYWT
jgi:hypothetical protein